MMIDVMDRVAGRRTLLLFGITSLLAIAAGCMAMAASGVAFGSWIRNPAAWCVGALLAAGLGRVGYSRTTLLAISVLTTVILTATLFLEGQQGVHRWIDVGPLHINAAALLTPVAVVSLGFYGIQTNAGVIAAAAIAAILLAQPDASQLTGFAVAAAILFLRSDGSRVTAYVGVASSMLLAGAGWLRPDGLEPVAEVEQIFALCWAVSPALAVIAGLALASASLSPLASMRSDGGNKRTAAASLAACFAVVALCPLLGWFPIPLVGLGMSFPVGYWLALGLLCSARRH